MLYLGNKYCLLLLFILVLSCSKKKKSKIYYKKGKKIIEYEYKNIGKDTILDGKAIFYYSNGRIEKKINLKNDTIEGNFLKYYKNGILECMCFYKKGKKLNGLYYNKKGNLNFYISNNDKLDKVTFKINYDNNGKIVKIQGNPIIYIDIDNKNKITLLDDKIINLKSPDTLNFTFKIATPPDFKVNFEVFSKGKTTKKLLSSTKKSDFIELKDFIYNSQNSIIIAKIKLRNDKLNTTIKDSLVLKLVSL